MTIDRIRIENFQRHELLDVRLDPGITTLAGPSDSGKSSVIRALRWLALNRPAGDGFVRRSAPDGSLMAVKARCDGVTVRRARGGSDNVYSVGADEYRAFGRDVPEEVARAVGLGPDNFAGQHDAPFWLGLPPAEFARELNRIVDLDVIDRKASALAARLRRLRAEEGVVAARLAEAKGAAAAGLGAAMAGRELEALEALDDRRAGLRRDVEALERAAGDLREAEAEAACPVPDPSALEDLRARAAEARAAANGLATLAEDCRLASERADRLGRDAAAAEALLKRELGGRCPLCGGEMS